MARNRVVEFSANGTGRTNRGKATSSRGKQGRTKQANKVCQRIAYAVGGVGVGVLGLSIVHCTDAISALTHSPWPLSFLLALGLDAGMVASELAELVAYDDQDVTRWAKRYVVVAIGLSMLLNAHSYASHATGTVSMVAGVVLGVVIPALVYMLGRVAGYLAK